MYVLSHFSQTPQGVLRNEFLKLLFGNLRLKGMTWNCNTAVNRSITMTRRFCEPWWGGRADCCISGTGSDHFVVWRVSWHALRSCYQQVLEADFALWFSGTLKVTDKWTWILFKHKPSCTLQSDSFSSRYHLCTHPFVGAVLFGCLYVYCFIIILIHYDENKTDCFFKTVYIQ